MSFRFSRVFSLFGGLLGEGADGSRRKLHLYAVDMLGLHIDFESAASSDIGMASLVSNSSSSSGQFTGSTHRIDCLITKGIVSWNRTLGKMLSL